MLKNHRGTSKTVAECWRSETLQKIVLRPHLFPNKIRKQLNSAYRVCTIFKTTSDEAIPVVGGMITGEVLIMEIMLYFARDTEAHTECKKR